jgi:hypothetical protein
LKAADISARIKEMAPRWHSHYRIWCNAHYTHVEFCGVYAILILNKNADIGKEWRREWTALEQMDWLAVLGQQKQQRYVIAGYPLISRCFDIDVDSDIYNRE